MTVRLRRLSAQETRAAFDSDYEYEELIRGCTPGSVYEITLGPFRRPWSVRWKLERAAERALNRRLQCSLLPHHLPSVLRFVITDTPAREENHDDDDEQRGNTGGVRR